MKSMRQMQEEMFSKARFDGGYPRIVIMPIGVVALARNEEEWISLMRETEICHKIFGYGLLLIPVGCFLAWCFL